ncbi:MAG: phospholipid carrier-dependent glycosyltransferase [Candidatus Methanomethylicaceae archaeon]|jgi:hypothetical protein
MNPLYYLIPLVLFLPGWLALANWKKINLSAVESLVFGCLLWNFLFVSLSYVFGIFSNLINEFFVAFLVLGLIISIVSIYNLIATKSLSFKKIEYTKLIFSKYFYLLCCIPFVILLFLLILAHSTSSEYDALFYYLPLAKSIILTHGYQLNYFQQNALSTTTSPAIPLMYALTILFSPNLLSADLFLRTIPIMYTILIALVVFLIGKEILKSKILSALAVIVFLLIPATFSLEANYSLYLDLPFTLFVFASLYALIKVYSSKGRPVWLFLLSMSISMAILTKDVSFMILPALLTIIIIPFLPKFKRSYPLLLLALSLLFVSTYETLFIKDFLTTSVPSQIILEQVPILLGIILFLVLSMGIKNENYTFPKIKAIFLFLLPFIPVIIFLIRNLLMFGAISSSFPFVSNNEANCASIVLSNSLGGKILPQNIFDVTKYGILFSDIQLGALFFLPSIIGIIMVAKDTLQKRSKESFILLSFFLILLVLWSRTLQFTYSGSEVRYLFYFSPLFAIFIVKGASSFSAYTKVCSTFISRFVAYLLIILFLPMIYLIINENVNITNIGPAFLSLGIADYGLIATFSIIFLAIFYLKLPKNLKLNNKQIKLIIVIILTSLLLIGTSSILSGGLLHTETSVNYVYPGWENNLNEVITYLNQNNSANSTIITCYALPISYFTNYSIIDSENLNGVMTLIQINSSDPQMLNNTLLEYNVQYLLYPNSGNNYFDRFNNLSASLPILNITYLNNYLKIIPVKEFTDYTLYKIP